MGSREDSWKIVVFQSKRNPQICDRSRKQSFCYKQNHNYGRLTATNWKILRWCTIWRQWALLWWRCDWRESQNCTQQPQRETIILSFRKKVLLTLFCFPIVTHQQLQIPAAKFIRNMYLILIHYIWNSIIIVKKIIQVLRCSQEIKRCLAIKISNKMQN